MTGRTVTLGHRGSGLRKRRLFAVLPGNDSLPLRGTFPPGWGDAAPAEAPGLLLLPVLNSSLPSVIVEPL